MLPLCLTRLFSCQICEFTFQFMRNFFVRVPCSNTNFHRFCDEITYSPWGLHLLWQSTDYFKKKPAGIIKMKWIILDVN